MGKTKTHSTIDEAPKKMGYTQSSSRISKIEQKQPTYEGTDEYRPEKNISLEEKKEKGVVHPLVKDTSGAPLAFKLRSGNGPLAFKEMGSSPAKVVPIAAAAAGGGAAAGGAAAGGAAATGAAGAGAGAGAGATPPPPPTKPGDQATSISKEKDKEKELPDLSDDIEIPDFDYKPVGNKQFIRKR